MRSAQRASLLAIGLGFLMSACGSGAQDATPSTIADVQVLVETAPESAGANCAAGGTLIRVGYDRNEDGELGDDEITSHSYICSNGGDATGKDGTDGANGANGVDGANGADGADGADGTDGADGADGTNGTDGTNGSDGTNGTDGTDGTNGTDGLDGVASLVRTAFESPGTNCLRGGVQIQFGPDSNRSGVLDDSEVTTTNYVCNGANGLNGGANGLSSLVRTAVEPPGAHCAAGGTRIEMGIDDNESTVLDPNEVDSVSFVCAGVAGALSLVGTSVEAPGAHCAAGGTRIDSGVDDNGNQLLDVGEIDQTIYVCNGLKGADGVNGLDGLMTLARTALEGPGANCSVGGLKLQTGLDTNKNGTLADSEVLNTSYVCNGQDGIDGLNGLNGTNGLDGLSTLVRTTLEVGGSHCLVGGLKVDTGVDTNHNGVLSDGEVLSTNYICNGQNGLDGVDGLNGLNGLNGTNGVDGLVTLARTTLELAGAHCLVGGLKLETGLDANKNGVLGDPEVQSTSYICNGVDGLNGLNGLNGPNGVDGLVTLARTTLELAGAHCLVGGLKLDSGLDTNKNGILNDAEVQTTNYVCNGQDGLDGTNGVNGLASLVRTGVELAGAHCVVGGLKLDTGMDTNKNGVLDDAEVLGTNYVCSGKNGLNGVDGINGTNGVDGINGLNGADGVAGLASLVRTSIELAGSHCLVGGLKLDSGLDTNKNGVLNDAEVLATSYVCNGQTGATGANGSNGIDGSNGLSSLVRTSIELAGVHCTLGGLKVDTGLDTNKNGVLDTPEVVGTNYVCNGNNGTNGSNGTNGTNGLTTLFKQTLELPGANCTTGGMKLQTGLDTNLNATLDAGEVTRTDYVCNGLNGLNGLNGTNGTNGTNALIKTVVEPPGTNCFLGGLKVMSGPDTNGNLLLDTSEVANSSYLCVL